MGRLPTHYEGRPITFRIPFTMPGELVLAASSNGTQFPEATFLHNSDKPFEIHRVIPRVASLDSNGALLAAFDATEELLLEHLTRIRIFDFSKNENLTKNAQLISTLVRGSDEKTWEWSEPYTLVKSEGFQVSADNIATNGIVGGSYSQTRLEIAFQGFLIVCQPPNAR